MVMTSDSKTTLLAHVEIAMHPSCATPTSTVREKWKEFLQKLTSSSLLLHDGRQVDLSVLPEDLRKPCCSVSIIDDDSDEPAVIVLGKTRFAIHAFVLSDEGMTTEEIETSGDDEWTQGCDSLPLPHRSLDGLWDNLIYDSHVKQNLLHYAQSAMLFSEKSVSSHVVHWNRIQLLYGAAGTGKTSLCKALAHKLAIRLEHRFPRATLLEIHSHSLFSKWFSTSGKLVSTLFQMVRDMLLDDPKTFICVLIDEVESLAATRGTSNGGDPSDAMRAVNSLLTSLDRLRSFDNVLILATTNLTGSVDAAFVDRVDLKIHIGMPILKARYKILQSCLQELIRVGIIQHSSEYKITRYESLEDSDCDEITGMLLACAKQANGLSGRTLRKLPLQAHARFLPGVKDSSAIVFLRALSSAIQSEQMSRNQMGI